MAIGTDVPLSIAKAMLDWSWYHAAEAANTLRDQILSDQFSLLNLFRSGSVASVGKNSANQSYRGPGVGSYTNAQLAEVYGDWLDCFDAFKAEIDLEISTKDPQAPPSDADLSIYPRMRGIKAVTEYQSDITDLFLPATLTAPVPLNAP